jgi:hypothetical protein
MGIGFIPRAENHDVDVEGMTSERWRAEQGIEVLVNMTIEGCLTLLKQVRRYAEQLECLDPLNHNAEQEVGKIVLALSYDESWQERLDTLTGETRRLMLAVAEIRCGRSKEAKPSPRFGRLAMTGQNVFLVVLWGLCLLFFVLIA